MLELEDELRIAEPGALIGFGGDVRWVLEQLASYKVNDERDHVQCGVLHLIEHAIPVYLIAHPRSSQWPGAHAALAAVLHEQQQE
jgi:hypothetical protein